MTHRIFHAVLAAFAFAPWGADAQDAFGLEVRDRMTQAAADGYQLIDSVQVSDVPAGHTVYFADRTYEAGDSYVLFVFMTDCQTCGVTLMVTNPTSGLSNAMGLAPERLERLSVARFQTTQSATMSARLGAMATGAGYDMLAVLMRRGPSRP
jgi:hypothetical protein